MIIKISSSMLNKVSTTSVKPSCSITRSKRSRDEHEMALSKAKIIGQSIKEHSRTRTSMQVIIQMPRRP